jgi:hypothetical protein
MFTTTIGYPGELYPFYCFRETSAIQVASNRPTLYSSDR